MDPAAAKQQIAERVKQASRFLVTVNANPTVDQLAACIGLTLLLNKMNKHATAVFSGKVPNTVEFLQPEKTIKPNADGLRDFIISLDKNKADKLRYKVEDDVVRIYITPYHTSLSQSDFEFAEGDFNVEVVIALGVAQRSNLDQAISSHGRILHDATVISVNTGAGRAPDLGQINWQDPQASSLSEMLVSISESFGTSLIDSQIATAFLTGIVAETSRFSNKKTTPKVMTMSAQLMAAGANQQLIVQKLEPPKPPAPPPPPPSPPKLPPAEPPKPPEPKKPKTPPPPLKPEGVIDVPKEENDKGGKTDIELGTTEIHIDEQGNIKAADELASIAPAPPPPLVPESTPLIPDDVPEPMPAPEIPQPVMPAPPLPPVPLPPKATETADPSIHSFMGATAQPVDPENPIKPATDQPSWADPYEMVPIDPMLAAGGEPAAPSQVKNGVLASPRGHDVQPPIETAVNPLNTQVDSARSAVESALSNAPFDPALNPVASLNAQPLPDVAHQEPMPAPTPAQPGDTPVLNLPFNSQGMPAIQPLPPPVTHEENAPPPPPPGPPPLMAAPGAIIPDNPPY